MEESDRIINLLKWDTDFFNLRIGEVMRPINSLLDFQLIEREIEENAYDLCYYSSLDHVPGFVFESDLLEIQHVDKKVVYSKGIDSKRTIDKSVSSYSDEVPNEKLYQLAILSGTYSRFNVDNRIGQEKFEKLFQEWIKNSINGILAFETLVFSKKKETVGLITIGEKNDRAAIGLIAVDPLFRGQGVGQSLMHSAEKKAYQLGYRNIQVITQHQNISACKLYEKCDYSSESIEFIYHLWNKKTIKTI